MARRRWQRIIGVLPALALYGLALTHCGGGAQPANLSAERPQVWHQPNGKTQYEVTSETRAGQADRVWTKADGVALLKWPDLWVKLYQTTDLVLEEVSPSGVGLQVAFGTTLNGGQPQARERVVLLGDYAEIRCTGTLFMACYQPATRYSIVRVFDGQVQMRNTTGSAQMTQPVLSGQWALVRPEQAPQLSNRLEDMRQLARDLGLWDNWHQAEVDAARGFGPQGSQVDASQVQMVFAEPSQTTPTPTSTAWPTVTRTRTPRATPTRTRTPTRMPTPSVGLRVDQACLQSGQCTTLRWDVENVSAVYVDGQGVTGHGTRQVCLGQTTTYNLRAVGPTGDVNRSVTVRVPTASLRADQTTLTPGQCTTLRWDVENARAVYLNGAGVAGHGSSQVCPTSSASYTLRVETDCGEINRTVTIQVTSGDTQGPSIHDIVVDPSGQYIGNCQSITISCMVDDPSIVREVHLLYLHIPSGGVGVWQEVLMDPVTSGMYGRVLGKLESGELQFNIRAWDRLGNQSTSEKVVRQITMCVE